jgi:hypothetical protein
MTRQRRVSQPSRRGLALTGAEQCGARLLGAHLLGAHLLGAHLLGASLLGASLLGASLLNAAGVALPFSLVNASADETTILSLPLSSRLTAQPPGASLRTSTQRFALISESDAESGEKRPTTRDFAPSAASTGTASAGAASTGTAANGAAANGAAATELSTESASDSPATVLAISIVNRPESPTAQASADESPANSRGGNFERSVLRETPSARPPAAPAAAPVPSRLPPVTDLSSVPPPVRPVRLPPIESTGTLPYGDYQRSPVQVRGEAIPAPTRSGGQLPPPYPSRLPQTNSTPGMPASAQKGEDPSSSDWVSSRWHRFKAQAQYDFWGYPEHFCERPLGLPNQMAYQAMVDNARDDLLVFHQYDFHDGQMEPAANLNVAGMRRIDRVADLLSRQAGGSTVIVEFVPEQPRLTDARREEVAAQLGRYGLHEPAVRVAIGRARRGISGREAQGIQRTFDRMTGASGLSGASSGMNSMGSGMNSMGGGMGSGGMSGGTMSGGMGVNQGSGMMGTGAGGVNGNSGAYGY